MGVQIRYVGPSRPGVTTQDNEFVPHGETIEVTAEQAGSAPKGKPGEEGYDPGSGYLAQPENWVRVSKKDTEKRSDA